MTAGMREANRCRAPAMSHSKVGSWSSQELYLSLAGLALPRNETSVPPDATVRNLFGSGSVYFPFKQLSACPPECEVGLVRSDRFEVVTNDVVIICETLNFQLRNCGRIGEHRID